MFISSSITVLRNDQCLYLNQKPRYCYLFIAQTPCIWLITGRYRNILYLTYRPCHKKDQALFLRTKECVVGIALYLLVRRSFQALLSFWVNNAVSLSNTRLDRVTVNNWEYPRILVV